MSRCTLTVAAIRLAVRDAHANRVSGPEFDRWLAAHDAEVAARALEEAADEIVASINEPDLPDDFLRGFDSGADDVFQGLRARAAMIRGGKIEHG